jgi:hypothetical protein
MSLLSLFSASPSLRSLGNNSIFVLSWTSPTVERPVEIIRLPTFVHLRGGGISSLEPQEDAPSQDTLVHLPLENENSELYVIKLTQEVAREVLLVLERALSDEGEGLRAAINANKT